MNRFNLRGRPILPPSKSIFIDTQLPALYHELQRATRLHEEQVR